MGEWVSGGWGVEGEVEMEVEYVKRRRLEWIWARICLILSYLHVTSSQLSGWNTSSVYELIYRKERSKRFLGVRETFK